MPRTDTDDESDMDIDFATPLSGLAYDAEQETIVSELFHSALYLRRQLQSLQSTISPVPSAEDLLKDMDAVPNALYNFLAWLFCGPDVNCGW